jgi:predicted DNA-binding protein (UPF0278 family)
MRVDPNRQEVPRPASAPSTWTLKAIRPSHWCVAHGFTRTSHMCIEVQMCTAQGSQYGEAVQKLISSFRKLGRKATRIGILL